MRAAPSQVLAPAGRTLRLLHDSVPGLVDGDYGPKEPPIRHGRVAGLRGAGLGVAH
jgi:hypothetical protein